MSVNASSSDPDAARPGATDPDRDGLARFADADTGGGGADADASGGGPYPAYTGGASGDVYGEGWGHHGRGGLPTGRPPSS